MDNELFELCKQVYEKTRWDGTKESYFSSPHPESEDVCIAAYDSHVDCVEHPLYTSDYLLEKLPPVTEVHRYTKFYSARHINVKRLTKEPVMFEADTPLKALLKLTLALPDECISKGVHE